VIEHEGYSEECTGVPRGETTRGEIPRESRQQILENSFRKTGAEKEKSNGCLLKGKESGGSKRDGKRARRRKAGEKNEIRA